MQQETHHQRGVHVKSCRTRGRLEEEEEEEEVWMPERSRGKNDEVICIRFSVAAARTRAGRRPERRVCASVWPELL